MTTDVFANRADTPNGPSRAASAVTPHATNEIDPLPKALYIGTGGDVTLRAVDSAADVLYKNVPSGAYLFVRAQFVRAAGTTASNIVAEA